MTHATTPLARALALLLAMAAAGAGLVRAQAEQAPRNTAAEPFTALLSAYEAIRAKLASDQVAAIGSDAASLQAAATQADAAATQADKNASAPLRKPLRSLAAAAKQLKDMPKKDADAVRRAFGELSRHVVALLAAEPKLRVGRHLFQCPMAPGYGQWVQSGDKLDNPYMGKRMPRCGSARDW
jgi:hypothetical protein